MKMKEFGRGARPKRALAPPCSSDWFVNSLIFVVLWTENSQATIMNLFSDRSAVSRSIAQVRKSLQILSQLPPLSALSLNLPHTKAKWAKVIDKLSK